MAVNALTSVSARIKSSCNLIGNRFEVPHDTIPPTVVFYYACFLLRTDKNLKEFPLYIFLFKCKRAKFNAFSILSIGNISFADIVNHFRYNDKFLILIFKHCIFFKTAIGEYRYNRS